MKIAQFQPKFRGFLDRNDVVNFVTLNWSALFQAVGTKVIITLQRNKSDFSPACVITAATRAAPQAVTGASDVLCLGAGITKAPRGHLAAAISAGPTSRRH